MAPQFTATNGPLAARRSRAWIARATSSLPVPLSPATSTDASSGGDQPRLGEHALHHAGCK